MVLLLIWFVGWGSVCGLWFVILFGWEFVVGLCVVVCCLLVGFVCCSCAFTFVVCYWFIAFDLLLFGLIDVGFECWCLFAFRLCLCYWLDLF